MNGNFFGLMGKDIWSGSVNLVVAVAWILTYFYSER